MLSKQLQIGKVGEHLVCADLILSGYNAFLSDQGTQYDLIVDKGGKIYRVQVKTVSKKGSWDKSKDVYRFHLRRGKHKKRILRGSEFDVCALVTLDINKIAYISLPDLIKPNGDIIQCFDLRDKSLPYKGRVYSNGTVRGRFGRFIQDYEVFPE